MNVKLFKGDCMTFLPTIKSDSVDLILCDPPYGTIKGLRVNSWKDHEEKTAWDNILPTHELFKQYERILRPQGVLILFSQEPYTHKIRSVNYPNLVFSYPLYWLKNHFGNPLISKKAPVHYIEDLSVFRKQYDTNIVHPLRQYAIDILTYTHQTTKSIERQFHSRCYEDFFRVKSKRFSLPTRKNYEILTDFYSLKKLNNYLTYDEMKAIHQHYSQTFNLNKNNFIPDVLQFHKPIQRFHPTQKPTDLLEYLIKIYTNKNMVVLDNTMGSGSTGVACVNTNRNFIGMELDEDYFKIAKERIKKADR